jgi:hypothetical protein
MAGPTYFEAAINIAKNEDWVVPFQYGYYDTDGVTVLPIDLTGSTIKMEIRIQETDHEALVSVFSPDNGIVFDNDDPTTGRFTITLLRSNLIRLATGSYVTDLVRLMPQGYQERIFEGTAEVVEGTTR